MFYFGRVVSQNFRCGGIHVHALVDDFWAPSGMESDGEGHVTTVSFTGIGPDEGKFGKIVC